MKKVISKYLDEIAQVSSNPRFQTILAHGVIELLVNTLVERHCKHGKIITKRTRDYPHSVKLVLLHEKGLLSDFMYKLLDKFRDLRNEAVHEATFEITEQRFKEIQTLINEEKPIDDFDDYDDVCMVMVFALWNEHKDLFIEVFESE